jgi:N-glycosidase YbiA
MENDDAIYFYEGEYYMFSNFSSFAVEYKGKMWMTAEHAYQAAKFEDEEVVDLIHKALSAHDSKKIAHAHKEKLNPVWNSIKVSVMEEIIRSKISLHPYVKEKLLESGVREIVEDSDKDSFWGRGEDFKGRNELGKVWMRLRGEMRVRE